MYDKILVSQYIATDPTCIQSLHEISWIKKRMVTKWEDYFMLKKLIKWIKSCFAGDVAVSSKSKAELDIKMADHKARNRGWRGPLNG